MSSALQCWGECALSRMKTSVNTQLFLPPAGDRALSKLSGLLSFAYVQTQPEPPPWSKSEAEEEEKKKPSDHTSKTTTKPSSFRPLAKQSSIARYTTIGQTVVNHSALQMESSDSPTKHNLCRTRWKAWDTKTRATASDKAPCNCITLHRAITLCFHVQQSWKERGHLKSGTVLTKWENSEAGALWFVNVFPKVKETGNAISTVWSGLLWRAE